MTFSSVSSFVGTGKFKGDLLSINLGLFLGCLLFCNGAMADPPSSLQGDNLIKKATQDPAVEPGKMLAALNAKLQRGEIKLEDYVALKDEWIKEHPLQPSPARNAPSTPNKARNIKGPENEMAIVLAKIRQSHLSSEEQILQIDNLFYGNLDSNRSRKKLPANTIPTPVDPDAKAIQKILADANKLRPDERVAEIDRQQAALWQHQQALIEKTRATAQSAGLNSALTPIPEKP